MGLRVWVLLTMWIAASGAGGMTSAFAQQSGSGVSVVGVVLDPLGGVIPGAQVELSAGGHAPAATTTTNASGAFRFDRVKPGTYDVRVTFEGFEPKTVHVTVGSRAPG